jgi:hypothetical protein
MASRCRSPLRRNDQDEVVAADVTDERVAVRDLPCHFLDQDAVVWIRLGRRA